MTYEKEIEILEMLHPLCYSEQILDYKILWILI